VRIYVSLRSAGICALLASLGTMGLAGAPAIAATTAGQGLATSGPSANRSNVGATHSPQLLQQLAGPAGVSGPVINGPLAAATAGPVTGAAQGVDIASFQHPNNAAIDWTKVAGAGIKFAAVKATEGAYYQNPFAPADLADAQAAGLSTIAYAFAIPNGGSSGSTQFSADPAVQADDLINYLTSSGVTVPAIMLDIEYDPYAGTDGTPANSWCYGLSQSAMVTWISSFESEVQAKTGWLPIIYTPAQWWTKCTGDSTAFGQAPVWVPNYTDPSPNLPAGWNTWNFWQYTSSGTVTGIPDAQNTDLDQANPAMITLLDSGLRQSAPNRSTDAGSPVGRQFSASDSSGQTPTFTASGLPPGLSIGGSGQVTGWPDAPGTTTRP
jgi:GH25 family lysozyme M1 (1,4-beta-N-acetylmuramidase)